MAGKATHQTQLRTTRSVPSVVDAGTEITMKARVSCPSGCELRGVPLVVLDGDRRVTRSELATHDGKANETKDFALTFPSQIGEYGWSVLFPRHDADGLIHEEASAPIAFRTRPHPTSVAVWDVPSPVVMNRAFDVKVGTTCSVLCPLSGLVVEVRDQNGLRVSEGTLGEAPWPETRSLYWTTITVNAPVAEDVFVWRVACVAGGLSLPHAAATATFTFRTARPPESRVTIRIAEEGTGRPVGGVEARLGGYMAFTDQVGMATIDVPKDTYDLTIRKDGYTAEPAAVTVDRDDLTVRVEASRAPTRAEMDERLMEYRDYPWG